MTTYLLDANVAIALTLAEHEHHDRASDWAATAPTLAICPIVEGALVRFLTRLGESGAAAGLIVRAVRRRCEFWPDDLSYADVSLVHLRGHRQVTATYLAALAVHHDGLLATLDESLASSLPHATLRLPEVTA